MNNSSNNLHTVSNEGLPVAFKFQKESPNVCLSNNELDRIPPSSFFLNFSRIISLDLSENKIVNLEASIIVKSCPYIQILNLDNNLLNDLSDFKGLQKLKNLKSLSFLGNKASELYTHIQLLEFFINCDVQKPKNACQLIAKASENVSLSDQLGVNLVGNKLQNLDKLQKNGSTLSSKKDKSMTKLANSNKIFALFAVKKCPPRKIGNFRTLEMLNGREILFRDLLCFLDFKHPSEIVEEKFVLKPSKNVLIENLGNEMVEENKKLKIAISGQKHKELKSKLIRNYLKKHDSRQKNFEDLIFVKDKEQSPLKFLFKIDKINEQRRMLKSSTADHVKTLWKADYKQINSLLKPAVKKKELTQPNHHFLTQTSAFQFAFSDQKDESENANNLEPIDLNNNNCRKSKFANREISANKNPTPFEIIRTTSITKSEDIDPALLQSKYLNFEQYCSKLPLKKLIIEKPEKDSDCSKNNNLFEHQKTENGKDKSKRKNSGLIAERQNSIFMRQKQPLVGKSQLNKILILQAKEQIEEKFVIKNNFLELEGKRHEYNPLSFSSKFERQKNRKADKSEESILLEELIFFSETFNFPKMKAILNEYQTFSEKLKKRQILNESTSLFNNFQKQTSKVIKKSETGKCSQAKLFDNRVHENTNEKTEIVRNCSAKSVCVEQEKYLGILRKCSEIKTYLPKTTNEKFHKYESKITDSVLKVKQRGCPGKEVFNDVDKIFQSQLTSYRRFSTEELF